MVNYDDLPLFPLHVVLFPEMPLPLHIFEPRYREMILRCREENSPFGIVQIQSGPETGGEAVPSLVGTTARIAQYEETEDGRMNILVFGDTRFQISRTRLVHPFLSGEVMPFGEDDAPTPGVAEAYDTVARLFKKYLRALLAMTGRSLSALQLPTEPEALSFAIASVLQVPLGEKQKLLELTDTTARLKRETQLLEIEIEGQSALRSVANADENESGLILPVDTQALGRLSGLN